MLNSFRESHPEELGEDGKLKVCIGGGAGFIGSHIAKRLREEVKKNNSFLSFVFFVCLFIYLFVCLFVILSLLFFLSFFQLFQWY